MSKDQEESAIHIGAIQ